MQHAVQFHVHFIKAIYRICFFVLGILPCPVLIDNQFMERNVDAIWNIEQRVQLILGQLPIFYHGTKEAQETKTSVAESQPQRHPSAPVTNDAMCHMRVFPLLELPAYTHVKPTFFTKFQDLCVLKPKQG